MAIEIRMPQLGMIMTEGTLAKWLKNPGSPVKQGEPLAEVTTEKISYELESPEAGILHTVVDEGDTVPVQGLIAYLLAEGEKAPEAGPKASATEAITKQSSEGPSAPSRSLALEGVRAAPGARRLAAQLGVDIAQVSPGRPGARIVEADVRAYAEGQKTRPQAPGMPVASRVEPLKGMRKTIAQKMRQSVSETAQLTFHLDVDVTEATELRRKMSQGGVLSPSSTGRIEGLRPEPVEGSKEHKVTISIVDIFIKACAEALAKHPRLNSSLRDGQLHFFDQVNISLAVALEDGLVAPVIRDVQKKGILTIAEERTEIVSRAREGRLMPDDMAGGTFTLTVLGSIEGFTPILNPGQSAILGVGRIARKPAVVGDEVVVRQMATLSLTVDHQVVDGAPAASFMRRLQQTLEHPQHLFKVGTG